MLTRVAQASRLGLTASRLSRSVVSPAIRIRPAAVSASPWVRNYAKNTKKTPQSAASSNADKNAPSQPAAESSEKAASEGQETTEAAKESEPIPFHKLPDLTQGIPSTLDQEMGERSGKSQSALESYEGQESSGGGRGRGKHEYVSTSERNRQWYTRFFLVAAGTGSIMSLVYYGRNWEDEVEISRHPDVPNGWGIGLWWQRVKARWNESISYYQDPAFDKLLPDPDPSFERPYTLCISLDDMLVHSEWTREHGWRVAKRPGMDYFVRYLSQYYELVLFTSVPFGMGEPLVRKLDPFRFIMWPLYREATKYEDGEVVKASFKYTLLLSVPVTNHGTGSLLSQSGFVKGHND